MVKLAHTIGASSIAQSVRYGDNLSSAVIEVRQGTWDDLQEKHMFRVMPFTDIQYSGAEVAAMNSVIASCLVPTVVGVDVGTDVAIGHILGPDFASKMMKSSHELIEMAGQGEDTRERTQWPIQSSFGMVDYLMGYSSSASARTAATMSSGGGGLIRREQFNHSRRDLWGMDLNVTGEFDPNTLPGPDIGPLSDQVAGTYAISIVQWLSEDQALDAIANNPTALLMGYVLTARDVKVFYTQTAVSMIVRRLSRIVEMLGPARPVYTHVGLGHVVKSGNEPWNPTQSGHRYGNKAGARGHSDTQNEANVDESLRISPPSHYWNAGTIAYSHRNLAAAGSLYIPQDQVPYSMMKRGFKFNHILTQVGLELMETL